ncbi:hypothetical protein BST61_g6203 [Cercospora zeina]
MRAHLKCGYSCGHRKRSVVGDSHAQTPGVPPTREVTSSGPVNRLHTRLQNQGLVPEFSVTPQVWYNNSLYGAEEDIRDLPQENAQQLMNRWHNLIPHYYYSISVFHQLHCLNAILKTFVEDRTGYSVGGHARRQKHFHHSRHILHCFDYLRQSIQC